jgi:hypothetical protein
VKGNAVHRDASTPGARFRKSLCGMVAVDTEVDVSRVSCKLCLARLRAPQSAPERKGRKGKRLRPGDALAELLAPKADPPPRITPELWAGSCKGGEHRRCGECALCKWEWEANLWGAPEVSAHNRVHQLRRAVDAPRWPSLDGALSGLVDFERNGRAGPSASGGILQRIELGPIDGITRADDPLMRRGGELVAVRKALELAYPIGGHAKLSHNACRALLVCRVPGILTPMPTYEVLATELGVDEGDVRAVVRHGRSIVSLELAERGLIPWPRTPRRGRVDVQQMREVVA